MIVVDLQGIFLPYCYPRFSKSISHESVTTDVESSLIPYLGLPVPLAPPSVALIIFYFLIFILSKPAKQEPAKQVWY